MPTDNMTADNCIAIGRTKAKLLSQEQRELLIDHIDGYCHVVVSAGIRHQSLRALIRHGILRWTYPDKRSYLTADIGRATLAAVLAQCIEAITRANIAVANRKASANVNVVQHLIEENLRYRGERKEAAQTVD
jgi:hypothetical protein